MNQVTRGRARANTENAAQDRASRWIDAILTHRGWVLAALVFITAIAAVGASRVGVSNALEIWFVDDDPALVRYHDFQETFGNDEVVVLAVHDDDGLRNRKGVATLRRIDESAASVDGIAATVSLATVDTLHPSLMGVDVGPAVPRGLTDREIATRIASDPLLHGRLVSEDGTTGLVLATMEAADDIDTARDGILAELTARLGDTRVEVWQAGVGVVYAALNKASMEDNGVFIAASYLVILGVLAFVFRRAGPVLLTLGVVGIAAVWMMGLYGAAGRDINTVTMVLPTLMLVIGVSDCVHFLTHAAERTAKGGDRHIAVRDAMAFMFWPCLFNTVTTAAGFASLAVAPMPVVRDLGLFAAIGVLGAFVASVVGCSIGLLWPAAQPAPVQNTWIDRWTAATATFALRHPRRILAAGAVLGLASLVGIAQLTVDTDSMGYLADDHRVVQDSALIERTFGPYTPMEFVVTADGALDDPEVLAAVAEWQDAMAAEPDVGWTRSSVDVLRRLNQALSDGEATSYRVPATRAQLDQAKLFWDTSDHLGWPAMHSQDGDELRITVGTHLSSARTIDATMRRLLAAASLPDHATVEASGYLPLYVRMMETVVRSQVASFTLAFVVVFALLAIAFRSVRLVLIAAPANLLPILGVLGLMGAVGIPLDAATVTISAVVLGLVVDDTTQMLYRFRHEFHRTGSHAVAAELAIRSAGRALVTTTTVLALGFGVLAFATIKSIAWFGVLVALAMVAAVVADLLLLPAALVVFRPSLGAPSASKRA